MSEMTLTFCDRCSPESRVGDKIRNGIGRGWAEWSEAYCLAILGWEKRTEGIVCPDCLNEEPGQ